MGEIMGLVRNGVRIRLLAAVAISASAIAAPASAQNGERQEYNVKAGDLGAALRTISRLSGREIIFSAEAVKGKHAPRLRGTYNADDAVRTLLEGSDLTAEFRKDVILIRGRSEASGEVNYRPTDQEDIVVTGSHIRGGDTTSPLISRSRDQISARGITDLGSYARSIPQNFTGGQNPGVVGSLQEGSENFSTSSTMNLRGIGADATLTLLNGHRVAYDAIGQGVDISAIPLAAVERIDVIADGSSALYGSDAVGGVANIILRRDFKGVETSIRFGAATDGGAEQQQYSIVVGDRWTGGGFMIAGDYNKSTAIRAGQRETTAKLFPTGIIYPPLDQISAVVAGHQDITDRLIFEIDGQFSRRKATSAFAFLTTSGYQFSGNYGRRKTQSYSVAPHLRLRLDGGWQAQLSGVIGSSDAGALVSSYSQGRETVRNQISYINDLRTAEIGADGPLFSLPAGEVQLAVGAGYRGNTLNTNIRSTRGAITTTPTSYVSQQDVVFGYGELSLPLFGENNQLPLIRLLKLTAALRYEDYAHVGGTATPKIGLRYSPVRDLDISATWGRSFKAPTLAQASRTPTGDLLPADFFVPEAPGGVPVLFLGGAIPGLAPERATSWNTTITYKPSFIEGLRIEASYFETHYRDRVVEPLGDGDGVFGNPIYNALILYSPAATQVNQAIANLPLGLTNQTGQPFNPAAVGAIADNRLQNAASQHIKGVDLAIGYSGNIGPQDRLELTGNATYLESDRKLSAGQPALQRAGTIFDPPHWRGSISASWIHDQLSVTGTANYIGGTLDDRFQPFVRVGSFTSFDLIGQLHSGDDQGPLSGVGVTLAVTDLFNTKPATIRNSSAAAPPYDATNYPVVGRVVSLKLTKRW